jgi:hypothetical protein
MRQKMHSILAEYGLPYEFPEAVEDAADAISVTIPKDEIKKRKDLRKILTFTIDPIDAKDFDDAISYQVFEKWEYGDWGAHCRRITLREAGKYIGSGGVQTCDIGVFSGSRGTDVTREIIEWFMFITAKRG